MRFSKVRSTVIRQEGDIGDLAFFGKAFLSKRSIDADRNQLDDLIQALVLFGQVVGLLFVHFVIDGGHHADDPNLPLPFRVGDAHECQIDLSQLDVMQLLSDLDAFSGQHQWLALREHVVALACMNGSVCNRHDLVREVRACRGIGSAARGGYEQPNHQETRRRVWKRQLVHDDLVGSAYDAR